MNTHDHDHDELPGDDELKALYRSLPRKEPSPALDAAIKRAAADAVRAQQHRKVTRWPVAVASVAVIVVAAGLGWRMMQQPSSVPQMPASRDVAMSAAPSNEPARTASTQGAVNATSHDAAPVASAPAARIASVTRKQDNIRSAIKPKLVAPAVVVQQAPAAATVAAPMAGFSEDRVSDAALAAPTPPPAPPAPVAEAVAPAYAPAPAAPPINVASNRSERAAMAMKTMAAPAAMPAPDATAANAADTPAQELAKIRQLVALQRHDEAVQRLLAFQQAHPDLALPDDLRAQLPDHE